MPLGVSGSGSEHLVDRIESQRVRILDAYREGLKSVGSAISDDPAALAQAMVNAEQILSDVFASLRAGTVEVDERYLLIAAEIGETRAKSEVHPSESMQASSIFFHVTMSTLAGMLPPEPASFEALTLIAVTLERSIGLRTRQALLAYTSFLLKKVHEVQIDERRRVARELHDRIGHGLSVTQLQLELYTLYRDSDPAAAFTKVETARQAVRESIQHLRVITSDLHSQEPVQSLERALMLYVEAADTEGVTVSIRVNGDEAWALPEVLDESFLILREAARNALRHARASMLVVNVNITPQDLLATVEDDGRGFTVREPLRTNGMGISAMAERAELLGGALAVTSRIGHGTQVRYSAPLRGHRR